MQDRFSASAVAAPMLDSSRPASTASITMFVRMIASNVRMVDAVGRLVAAREAGGL